MSITYTTNVEADVLLDFLLDQHVKDTGIPVHPFSVVNATMETYNRTLGITDGNGTLFVEDGYFNAFGYENKYDAMLTALRRCNVKIKYLN